MEKNYKRNARYFTGATMGWLSTICWIVAIVCVVLLFLRLRIPYLYWISGIVALIAVICGFVFSSHSVSDKEYAGVCNGLEKEFRTRFVEFAYEELNKNNGRGKAPVAVDEEKIRYSHSFLYDGETMMRVGQDDRRRTSKITFAAYMFEKNKLFVGYELHGLTAEAHEEIFGVYPFTSIESIESSRPEGLSPLADYSRVCIKLVTQEEPVEFWRTDDAELVDLISTVQSRMVKEADQEESAE